MALISTPSRFFPGQFVQTRTGPDAVYLVRSVTYHMGGAITYEIGLGTEVADAHEAELVAVLDADGKAMDVESAGPQGVCHIPNVDEQDEGEDA